MANERREITVQLGLDPKELSERELRERFAALVQAALERVRGWRPAGPVDLDSLLAAERVKQGQSRYSKTEEYHLLYTSTGRRDIGPLESVTIELEPEVQG